MTSQEFNEIIESMRQAERKGYTGFVQFYQDLLNEADRTGKLPPEAYPEEPPLAEGPEDDE